MKKPRRPSPDKPHDTPVLGPRGRRRKVSALPPEPRGHRYDPGVPPPRPRDPWIDEGEPEPNG
ncbi:MAG: hypothetical protein ACREJ9_07090 [Candidatus Rokuibacteriota bacterium]